MISYAHKAVAHIAAERVAGREHMPALFLNIVHHAMVTGSQHK